MRAKSAKRLQAEQLRHEEGLSYNEIAAKTGISKSTLSHWLRDVPLAPEHEQRLQERLRMNRGAFAARALPINRQRYTEKRRVAYQGGSDMVSQLPSETAVHELAFAMLYLGEGTKTFNRVMIGNTSPEIVKYSLWALTQIFRVDPSRLTYRLHLIEAARSLEEQLIGWWSIRLQVPREQFQKSGYDRRPRQVDRTEDYHGVCTIQCHDTYLQQRILGLAHGYLAAFSSGDE